MSIYGKKIPVISNDTAQIRIRLERGTVDCPEDCNPTSNAVALSGSYKLTLELIALEPPTPLELYSHKLENGMVYFDPTDVLVGSQPGRYTAALLQGTELLSEFQVQLSRAGDYVVDVTTSLEN